MYIKFVKQKKSRKGARIIDLVTILKHIQILKMFSTGVFPCPTNGPADYGQLKE